MSFYFVGLLLAIVYELLSSVSAQSQSCYLHNRSLPFTVGRNQAIYHPQQHCVYLFGGDNQNGELTQVHRWNLSDPGSWFEAIATTPTTPFRSTFANNAVLIDDDVYFIGMTDSTTVPLNTQNIRVFSTRTATWSIQGTVPWIRRHGCIATNSTHIIQADGYDGSLTPGNTTMNIYDITAKNWTQIPVPMLVVGGWRDNFCALIDGAFYAWGGRIEADSGDLPTSDVWKLDLSTLQVSKVAFLGSYVRSDGTSASYKRLGLTIAAWDPYYGSAAHILAYDFESGLSSVRFWVAVEVHRAAAVIIEDKIYIFGGVSFSAGNNEVDSVQICDLATPAPTSAPSTPTESPTNHPTSEPTVEPTATPTVEPTEVPTIEPTEMTTTSMKEEQPIGDPTDPVSIGAISGYIIAILVAGIPLILMCFACCFHRKRKGSDYPSYLSLFSFFVSIGDFYTDAIFALTLYTEANPLFIWACLFSFGPHGLSIIIGLFYLTKWRQSKHEMHVADYAHRYDKLMIMAITLSGFYATVQMATSHLFHLSALSMPIGSWTRRNILNLKIINNVILENVPLFCIQYVYLSQTTQASIFENGLNIPLLAMTFSITAILFGILTISLRVVNGCLDCTRAADLRSISVVFELKSREAGAFKSYHVHTQRLLSSAMRIAFHVELSQIEVMYVKRVSAGIQVRARLRYLEQAEAVYIEKQFSDAQSECAVNFRNECARLLRIENASGLYLEVTRVSEKGDNLNRVLSVSALDEHNEDERQRQSQMVSLHSNAGKYTL